MTALLVLGAVLAFIIFVIRRNPILRTLFAVILPILLPFLFSRGQARHTPGTSADLSEDEARDILGVGPYASRDEIMSAHHRLMKQLHPDRGGSSYFAARINHARDVLLKDAGVTIDNSAQ